MLDMFEVEHNPTPSNSISMIVVVEVEMYLMELPT